MEKENLKNYYTAENDQQVLSIREMKEILNQIPEEMLDFEMVCVEKMNGELRGIPISNVILDVEGKQLTLFNFMLRQKLRIDALRAQLDKMEGAQEGTNQ